ncbi:hypothetical protein [Streptomyces chrestomyceticus]|uniref:Uncharacterized protein n=1 Tax=Streptomyces chrestomyceticus TaxID=68185 RepID=A0ABU7X2B2_9ACTN
MSIYRATALPRHTRRPRLQYQQEQRQPVRRRTLPGPPPQQPGRCSRTVTVRPARREQRLAQPEQRRQLRPLQPQWMTARMAVPRLPQRQQRPVDTHYHP